MKRPGIQMQVKADTLADLDFVAASREGDGAIHVALREFGRALKVQKTAIAEDHGEDIAGLYVKFLLDKVDLATED